MTNWMQKNYALSQAGIDFIQAQNSTAQLALLGVQDGSQNVAIFLSAQIDLKTAATTTIGTTVSNKGLFIPTEVGVICTAVSGFISAASASFGTNGTTLNDMLAITALTGLSAANMVLPISIPLSCVAVPVSTAMKIKVTTGATTTSQAGYAFIKGFYTGL